MPQTAIIISQPQLCKRLEAQLDLLSERPKSLGWIITGTGDAQTIADIASPQSPILGMVDQLEAIIERTKPELALISLPAAMSDLVTSL